MIESKEAKLPPIVNQEAIKVFFKSPAGIALSHWFFQDMRSMNLKEKLFRLISEFVLLVLMLQVFMHYSWFGKYFFSILFTHTIFWILFSNVFVIIKNLKPLPLSREKLIAFLEDFNKRAQGEDSIAAAAAIGSISKAEFQPSENLEIRLLSEPGLKNYFKTFLFCMLARTRALVRAFPLNIYIFEKQDFETKVSEQEKIVLFSDPKKLFARHPAGTVDAAAVVVALKYPPDSAQVKE